MAAVPLRVALLTYSTRPRGGVVHTLALAEALAASGAVVDVHAVARDADSRFFRGVDPRVGLRLARIDPRTADDVESRVLASIAALAAAVDPAAYDVVHAQDCISANAVPGAIRTVHHLDDFTTPALARCHERALVEPPVHVCVSRAVAAELRAGWGIHATVIPNGVEARRFGDAAGPAGASARASWARRLDERTERVGTAGGAGRPGGAVVLAVGGIEPRKGSLELLEAVALLRRRRPGARLVVAGGETLFDYRDYRSRYERRSRELGVVPIVLGPVDHDDLPALVAGCDAFAMPSRKEGFGLAAMEALAARRPLVLSDLPVLREVFGDAARYGADPGGLAVALDAALGGDDPGGVRADAGAALAARHDWGAAAAAHLELYARRRHGAAERAAIPDPRRGPDVAPPLAPAGEPATRAGARGSTGHA